MASCHVRTSNSKAIQESAAVALYQGTILIPRDKHQKTNNTSIVLCKAHLSFFLLFISYVIQAMKIQKNENMKDRKVFLLNLNIFFVLFLKGKSRHAFSYYCYFSFF